MMNSRFLNMQPPNLISVFFVSGESPLPNGETLRKYPTGGGQLHSRSVGRGEVAGAVPPLGLECGLPPLTLSVGHMFCPAGGKLSQVETGPPPPRIVVHRNGLRAPSSLSCRRRRVSSSRWNFSLGALFLSFLAYFRPRRVGGLRQVLVPTSKGDFIYITSAEKWIGSRNAPKFADSLYIFSRQRGGEGVKNLKNLGKS